MISTAADSAPAISDLFTQWRPDYLSTAAAVLVAAAYVRNRRAAQGTGLTWPVHRDLVFGIGILAVIWTCSGFLQARADELMWAWTAQQLLLLLVIPILVLAAQPVSLMRTVRPGSLTARALRSAPVRVLGHPLVGPVLVPVVCLLLFFGGLGEASLITPESGWGLHLLLLAVGVLVALPLVDRDDHRTSLALGLALGVGMFELILDAFPGIVLRLQTHLTMGFFGVDRPAWSPSWVEDQHTAGSILWVVAELLDLPFLLLVATRWIKVDAREAARIDAELDAQLPAGGTGGVPTQDRPWWLDDPQLRDRYHG